MRISDRRIVAAFPSFGQVLMMDAYSHDSSVGLGDG